MAHGEVSGMEAARGGRFAGVTVGTEALRVATGTIQRPGAHRHAVLLQKIGVVHAHPAGGATLLLRRRLRRGEE
jgi:hypothetical protein